MKKILWFFFVFALLSVLSFLAVHYLPRRFAGLSGASVAFFAGYLLSVIELRRHTVWAVACGILAGNCLGFWGKAGDWVQIEFSFVTLIAMVIGYALGAEVFPGWIRQRRSRTRE